jgi:hypothetical protein
MPLTAPLVQLAAARWREQSALCFEVAPPAAPSAETEVQLCRTGSFYRADQGKFKVTRGMLEVMVANACERGVDIPLKLTHDGNTFAAGWVSPASLQVRPWRSGYGLFGLVTWAKDEALLSAVRAGRSKYISPEIVWADRRMADSPRGHAGEPIGPVLCGAALVLDPFFSMDAIQFSRFLLRPVLAPRLAAGARPKPLRYAMDQSKIDKLKEILKARGLPEEALDGAVLDLMLALSGEAPAEEAPAEEPMPAENPAPAEIAAAATPAAPAISAARDAQFERMAARLAELEAKDKAREAAERASLFAAFEREGRLRFADAAEARRLLDTHGADAFRAAYGRVPALVEQAAPAAPAALPTAATVATSEMAERAGVSTSAIRISDDEIKAYQARTPGANYRQALKALSAERAAQR